MEEWVKGDGGVGRGLWRGGWRGDGGVCGEMMEG